MKLKILLLAIICVLVPALGAAQSHSDTKQDRIKVPIIKQSARDLPPSSLDDGNKMFVGNKEYQTLRKELSKGQHPRTIVLTCSDSRVAPEIVFSKTLGELFVVRNAGNVIDSVALGSIEYAAEHLHSSILLVLGHTKCGAVTAACSGRTESPYINSIISNIEPAVAEAKHNHKSGDELIESAAIENVQLQIKNVMKSKIIEELVESGKLKIIGGIYNISTGKVEILESEPHGH